MRVVCGFRAPGLALVTRTYSIPYIQRYSTDHTGSVRVYGVSASTYTYKRSSLAVLRAFLFLFPEKFHKRKLES